MKKSFLLIMCLLLAFVLVACNQTENKGDDTTAADTTAAVETVSDTESSETTAATEETTVEDTTTEEVSSEETTEEDTGLVQQHTHTFSDKWTADDDNHWHAATCEHGVEVSEMGAHVDANDDDECDVCKYDLSCDHELSDDIEGIAAGHYHVPDCEHDDLILDLTAHTGVEDGVCDVCDYSFDDLIDDITSTDAMNRVNGGTIAYVGQYETRNITYQLGFGYLFMDENTEYSYDPGVIENTKHSVHLFKNGNVFYLKEAYDMVSREEWDITADNVNGFKFSSDMFFYISLDDSDPCGAENLLYSFYTYAKTNHQNNLSVTWGDTNVITFAQGDEYSAKVFTIEFVISESGVITSLNLTSKNYWDIDVDYTIDADTGVITLLDTAEADATITVQVNQTEGSREDIKSSYNLDEIVVTAYDITTEAGEVLSDVITIEVGSNIMLPFANLNPTTANLELDKITATVYDETGTETWYASAYAFSDRLSVNASRAGNYVMKLTTLATEKTFQIVVTTPATTEIHAAVADNWGNKEIFTTKELYVDAAFEFVAMAQNGYADATFTAEITSGTGATLTELETADGYCFKATEAGTYVVTITSKSNPSVTNTVTFVVSAAPSTGNNFRGTWENSTYGIYVEINPTDSTSGTYTITMNNSPAQFSYTLRGTEIDAIQIAGATSNWTLGFTSSLGLELISPYGMAFDLTQTSTGEPEGGEGEGEGFNGTYSGMLNVMGADMPATVEVTSHESFDFTIDGSTVTYYFSIDADTGYFTTVCMGSPMAEFIFRYIADTDMVTVEMVHPMTGMGMEIGALAKGSAPVVEPANVMDGKYAGTINLGSELSIVIEVEEMFDTMYVTIDGIEATYAYSMDDSGLLTTICVGGETFGDFEFQYFADEDVISVSMYNPRLGYYSYAGDVAKVTEEEPAAPSINGNWSSADGMYMFTFWEADGDGTVDFSDENGEWLKTRGFYYTIDAEGNITFTSIKGNLSGYMDWSTSSTAKYVDGAIILTLDTGVEVVLTSGGSGW